MKTKVSSMMKKMRNISMCQWSREEEREEERGRREGRGRNEGRGRKDDVKSSLRSTPSIATWMLFDDIREHEVPVIQCDELEQGETGPGQVSKPIWVHLPIQATPNNSKDISG